MGLVEKPVPQGKVTTSMTEMSSKGNTDPEQPVILSMRVLKYSSRLSAPKEQQQFCKWGWLKNQSPEDRISTFSIYI
jgi:hypothetical protein